MTCRMQVTSMIPLTQRMLLESRLRYHHRCLREDTTNPDLTTLERLTLVRDRVARMREIERELEAIRGGNTHLRSLVQ